MAHRTIPCSNPLFHNTPSPSHSPSIPERSVDSPDKGKYIEAEDKLGAELKETRGSLAHWTAHHENSKLTTELGLPPSSLSALDRKSAPAALDGTSRSESKVPVKPSSAKRKGGSNSLKAVQKSIAHWTAHHENEKSTAELAVHHENEKSTAELELPPSHASAPDTKVIAPGWGLTAPGWGLTAPAPWRPPRTADAERDEASDGKGERVGGDASAHSWRQRSSSPKVSLAAAAEETVQGVGDADEAGGKPVVGDAEDERDETRADIDAPASKTPSEPPVPCYVHLCPCVGGSGSGT